MAQVNTVKKSHSDERKERAVFLSTKRSKTTKKNSWVDKDLTKQNLKKMFWRERSCIECYKEKNHYELSGRRPKQIPYEKEEKKEDTKESKCHVFVKQVVFLTMNHRGPLPLRELHSTDETLAWRDPGGSWACLRPVYHYGSNHPIRVAVTRQLHRN